MNTIVEPVNVEMPSMGVRTEETAKDDSCSRLLIESVLTAEEDAVREDIFAIFVVIVEPTSEDMLIELTVSVDPVIEDTPS